MNIPIGAQSYDAGRDCPGGECVIAKIEEFTAELRDRTLPARQRLEALKFVIHFVGDVHQPLHASDNNDRGGNDVHVVFEGHRTNLHAVWDTRVIEEAVRGDERTYALHIVGTVTPDEIKRWQTGSAIDWANESHDIAAMVIYGKLDHEPGPLPASYARDALPIIDEQLERAGVRLAAVLNQALS